MPAWRRTVATAGRGIGWSGGKQSDPDLHGTMEYSWSVPEYWGDRKHLLILKRFDGIPIVTAAQAVAMAEAA